MTPTLLQPVCCSVLYREGTLLHSATWLHQGREFIASGALENGAFCNIFSEIFHKN
jgi:hypothetical protein